MISQAWNDLNELIQIPAFSREEEKRADWFENRLYKAGVKSHRFKNNVWAYAHGFDENKPTLLLNSHIDTVKDNSNWSFNPFKITRVDEFNYGLGINDAGASLIGLLTVFIKENNIRKKGKSSNYNLVYLASSEEEISGENGVECVLPLIGPISMGIVGEPTGFDVAIAEKGLLVVDGVIKGESGHAARSSGQNSIYLAIEDIIKIRNHKFDKISSVLGESIANVTVFNSGKLHNVIPDSAQFTIDIRLNELYTHEEILHELNEFTKAELSARSMRLSPSFIQIEHPLVKACKKVGLKGIGSSTLSDQALMNFPTIKLGIGESNRSHTSDEYILTFEFEYGILRYEQLLNMLENEIMECK